MTASDLRSDSAPQPAKPRRRWYQFSLRTAGIGIFLLCLLLGSFAWWRDRAERQRKVVEELRGLGAMVEYRYFSLTNEQSIYDGVFNSSEPGDEFFLCSWLRRRFGEDFVSALDSVYLGDSVFSSADAKPSETTRLGLRVLQRCPRLKTLELTASAVSGADFEKLPFFESLEELSIVTQPDEPNGLLSNDNLAVLERASCLRVLELNGHPIGDVGVRHLRNCRRLEVLKLSDTKVGDEGLGQLCELTELFMLELEGTLITDRGLKHLCNMDKLRYLMLNRTGISGEGLADVGPKLELETLDISNTSFTDDALRHLKQFPNLQSLSLHWTKITGPGTSHLVGLKGIGSIHLEACPVTDDSISKVRIPDGWTELSLSGTQITDRGFCTLKIPKSMSKILIDHTGVTDASLDHLQSLPDLYYLSIEGTHVTPEGIQSFRSLYPRCDIR